jgi:hypothetical protein
MMRTKNPTQNRLLVSYLSNGREVFHSPAFKSHTLPTNTEHQSHTRHSDLDNHIDNTTADIFSIFAINQTSSPPRVSTTSQAVTTQEQCKELSKRQHLQFSDSKAATTVIATAWNTKPSQPIAATNKNTMAYYPRNPRHSIAAFDKNSIDNFEFSSSFFTEERDEEYCGTYKQYKQAGKAVWSWIEFEAGRNFEPVHIEAIAFYSALARRLANHGVKMPEKIYQDAQDHQTEPRRPARAPSRSARAHPGRLLPHTKAGSLHT